MFRTILLEGNLCLRPDYLKNLIGKFLDCKQIDNFFRFFQKSPFFFSLIQQASKQAAHFCDGNFSWGQHSSLLLASQKWTSCNKLVLILMFNKNGLSTGPHYWKYTSIKGVHLATLWTTRTTTTRTKHERECCSLGFFLFFN